MKRFKFALNRQLLITCCIYLLSILVIQKAFAHQPGVIDSHFTVGHTTVKLMYTIPSKQLISLAKGKNTVNLVESSFTIKSDENRCRVITGSTTKPLENIDSQQFFITYKCPEKLGNVVIIDELASASDYKNYTRFTLIGMSKSVVFSAKANTHSFPVGYLLSKKRITLKDDEADNQETPELNWQNFIQSSYYLPVGLEHILLGPDHILFLLGLLLLITSGKSLLILITCFTLSHSVALALAVLDIVNLSTTIIEPLIALSIVYVALENLTRLRQAKPGTIVSHGKHQWLVVTLFGFVHGFGFSFLLKEMGHTFGLLPALTFFNLGVEIGQLAVVVPLFFVLNRLNQSLKGQPIVVLSGSTAAATRAIDMTSVKQAISLTTGLMGLFWLIERTLF